MKSWQVIGGLLLTWLVLMMYMSSNLMGSGEGSSRVERQLRRALDELDMLHSQNLELQNLATELKQLQGVGDQAEIIQKLQSRLQKATIDLEKLSGSHLLGNSDNQENNNNNKDKNINNNNNPSTKPRGMMTLSREKARRKVENTATELWYYINSKMKELAGASGAGTLHSMVSNMQVDLQGYQKVMVDDFRALRFVDGDEDWRLKESLALGNLVQRRLEFLQNPKNCNQAKQVVCDLQKGCGFGCQLHHVTYCLIVAYATRRTLVLESKGWRYASRGWSTVFKPLSNTCTTHASGNTLHWGASQSQMESAQIIKLPIVDSLHPRPDFMPLAIPADLAPRLNTFHGDASVWWIGQMVRYLMRPNEHLKAEIKSAADKMHFERPIVGVHVRRTDKVGVEAAFHSLDEYMAHVEAYYNQREHHEVIKQRRVYLATDDPSILSDAKSRYSRYEFISDNSISRLASLGSRYTDSSLRGIIMDIHFLSMSDFLVCTFSSQVCRVAYELMQTMHGDASTYFRSLDDVFYYGGQNAHNLRAIESHKGRNKDELSFQAGDMLGIAGNHWNGYSKGTHRNTGSSGLFPSYKVENNIVAVQMPTYPEVKEEEAEEEQEGEEERLGVAVDYGHR